ncbi:velvet factor-domain-containing protein [Mycena crocata]|nr:velvet factor-domain-containing protein [Mycena crocata]
MISAPSQQGGAEPHHHHYNLPQHQGAASGNLVGRPIHFTVGQFAGKTIRAELQELQAAAFGRKYAKVDRRPLDPPPVVQLRLFEVLNVGTEAEREVEIDYDNIHILGLMCTVELLPVDPPEAPSPSLPRSPGSYGNSPYSSPPRSPNDAYSFDLQMSPIPGYAGERTRMGSPEGPMQKATTALAGTTFVQVDSIPWNARTCLLFTFADLAVKSEGYFILQYRFFDLFSKPAHHVDQPIQADCCGARFRIYSSKEVPPLGKSTELSKHLARYGVRINVRETVRKRRKREESPPASPPYTTERVHDQGPSDASEDEDD